MPPTRPALSAGGKDEGAPGLRTHYHPNYYGAYLRDPTATRSAWSATSLPDAKRTSRPRVIEYGGEASAMVRLSRRTILAAPAMFAAARRRARRAFCLRAAVRIVIGYPVGGGADEMARVIAGALQQRLSRPVTIENRPGAAGAAVGEFLKKAPTDGSVLGFIPTATLIGRLTTKSFPFDPQTDVMPLTLAGTYTTGFAVSRKINVPPWPTTASGCRPPVPRALASARPRCRASPTIFWPDDRQGARSGMEAVYYKGASPLVADLEQGKVPAATSGLTSLLQHHRGSRLRYPRQLGQSARQDSARYPDRRRAGLPRPGAAQLVCLLRAARPVAGGRGGLGTRVCAPRSRRAKRPSS